MKDTDGLELAALFNTINSLIQICGKNKKKKAARRKQEFVSS